MTDDGKSDRISIGARHTLGMPQSLANVLVHLVFSTKERLPLINDAWRGDMHAYIGGIVRRRGTNLLAANSVTNHIHLLFPLPRTITIADLVREIKTGSALWTHGKAVGPIPFHWQAGYGIFSVSPQHREVVMRYIANQEKHHQTVSFQDEFRQLLNEHDIAFDENYVWE